VSLQSETIRSGRYRAIELITVIGVRQQMAIQCPTLCTDSSRARMFQPENTSCLTTKKPLRWKHNHIYGYNKSRAFVTLAFAQDTFPFIIIIIIYFILFFKPWYSVPRVGQKLSIIIIIHLFIHWQHKHTHKIHRKMQLHKKAKN